MSPSGAREKIGIARVKTDVFMCACNRIEEEEVKENQRGAWKVVPETSVDVISAQGRLTARMNACSGKRKEETSSLSTFVVDRRISSYLLIHLSFIPQNFTFVYFSFDIFADGLSFSPLLFLREDKTF